MLQLREHMSAPSTPPADVSTRGPNDRHVMVASLQPSRRLVYDRCMSRTRTNVELDDEALRTIMERYSLRTKTEAVDLALRHLAGQPLSNREALALRGARLIDELPEDTAPA